jgi:hypothetical protein
LGWIRQSRLAGIRDVFDLFNRNNGFYRPIVSLTFSVDYALFHLKAQWYGYTNLILALICAALLFKLSRDLGLQTGAAALAAAIWALNFHGINMAILWISGRTELLLVACSLAAAVALVRGNRIVVVVFVWLALLSKEEAVLLPAILVVTAIAAGPPAIQRRRIVMLLIAGFVAELVAYIILRAHAGAMTPATAPSYYRFVPAPAAVARNVAEYADRAFTFAAGVALIARAALRPTADRPRLVRRHILIVCSAWFTFGYSITVFLPVRSSLYASKPTTSSRRLTARLP